MKRRFFLFAAPAIVAAPSLMRVSTLAQLVPWNVDAEWVDGRLVSGWDSLVATTIRNRAHLLAEGVRKNNALLEHLMACNWVGSIEDVTYYGRPNATLAPAGWEEDADARA